MVVGREGVSIYGGAYWYPSNLTEMDTINIDIQKYLDVCSSIIDYRTKIEQINDPEYIDLSVNDMGTDRWEVQFRKTGDQCFNISYYLAFQTVSRIIRYSTDLYQLPLDKCIDDCTPLTNGSNMSLGACSLGRCTCRNGVHGDNCAKENCKNSLCFVDIDTIDP
mmetsp:Transcript_37801/g.36228  ORF Transcript_37801/g.36228 Transcript_37801/m.36228 type:complete len:164 (+) Transcript_37801:893-1384(+)